MSQYNQLTNGIVMPPIGYGTWGLETGKPTTAAVLAALEAGYRYIDTAYSYGNDFYTGKALKTTSIARSELFVTNKVWTAFQTREAVVESCKKSLKFMKLDYFDSYLVHWPVPVTEDGWKEINRSVWQGMEQLYQEGCVRSIGVSNFLSHHLEALGEYDAQIMPMVNQIEFHPGCLNREILDYCRDHSIVVQGWSPLGSSKVLAHDQIRLLAAKYQKTPAQICLRWAVQQGVIPVPRSQNPERMIDNLKIFDFQISPEDMMRIDTMEPVGRSEFVPDLHHPD